LADNKAYHAISIVNMATTTQNASYFNKFQKIFTLIVSAERSNSGGWGQIA